MTQPGAAVEDDSEDVSIPGSPRWYLSRLTYKLLGRQARYDKLERYALGQHDFPNGDKRYVVALRELQKKCRTNYCELVIHAVTQRMKVIGFQFGPEAQVDEDAKRIWNASNMAYQSPININMAASFGDSYILVSPPDEDNPLPTWTVEDPRLCVTEPDPTYPSRSLAGMKLWQEDASAVIYAALYLPGQVRLYRGPSINDLRTTDTATLTHWLVGRGSLAGGFQLIDVQTNDITSVPLVRGNWQPAFGNLGRAEHESVLDIQNRINHTVLDRLVIAKSQAYNQRWITGAQKGDKFRPGADMVWATLSTDANFGQFDAADITQILAAVRDDVGDLAAVSQTPATYLMNRMVNVSGDTLTQDQSALVTKVGLRSDALGWQYSEAMRISFEYLGNTAKAEETEVCTLWKDPEIHDLAKTADAFSKFIAGGVPLDLAMKTAGIWSDDQIENAVQQAEQKAQQELQQQQDMMKQQAALGQKVQQAGAKLAAKPAPKKGG